MFFGRKLSALMMALALVIAGGTIALAKEHPSEHPSEHPTAGKKGSDHGAEHAKEHPEHPAKSGADDKAKVVTKEELGEAISMYVANDAKLKGGYFLVFDPVAKQPLALTLAKVHQDRLSRVAKDLYFACADFRAHDGKMVYDLDVFMTGPDKAHLKVTEISVHKESGVERYGWIEKDGVWSKVPVKAPEKSESKGSDHKEGKSGEHPQEHPQEHPKGGK